MSLRRFLASLAVGMTVLVTSPSLPVQGAEPPASEPGVDTRELDRLVEVLEDSQKRELFLKDVKALIRAQEAAEGGKESYKPQPAGKAAAGEPAVQQLFRQFDSLSESIVRAGAETIEWLSRAPQALNRAQGYLFDPRNQKALLRLFVNIGAAVVLALIVGLLLKLARRRIPERQRSFPAKLGVGLVRIVLGLIPYGALLIALFVLFDLLPSIPVGQSLVFLFFMVLLFYRASLAFFRALLSPDEENLRIFPLSDEYANYFWIWVRRFADYTALYFLIVRTLDLVEIAATSFAFIRGVLLIIYPLMISVFLLQVRRELRSTYESRFQKHPEKKPRRTVFTSIRWFPLIAVVYCWAVFLFLVVNYNKGFAYLSRATIKTAVALLVLFFALKLLDWVFNRFFAISKRVKERFPGLEQKTNRYIRIIRKGAGVALVIAGLGVVAQIWGLPVDAFVTSKAGALVIVRAIAIILTLGVVLGIIETSQFVSDHLLKTKSEGGQPSQKKQTLVPIVNTAIKIGATFVGGVIILGRLGVNTTPILAGAGIVGLAVGFGSQTLVKDLINGLFILFENSIRVGDWVIAGGRSGLVESIGLRTVRLRDLSGNFHVVPNSSIDTLTNYSKDFSRYVLDVGIAYREDVEEVTEIIREVARQLEQDEQLGPDILQPIQVLGLDRFDDSAIVIRSVVTTKPLRQWAIKREFNRRIKKIFDERGIEIPFPHRTIYMGEPKKGFAAPMQVQLNRQE
jgi:small conductance mechanosensitive channel